MTCMMMVKCERLDNISTLRNKKDERTNKKKFLIIRCTKKDRENCSPWIKNTCEEKGKKYY